VRVYLCARFEMVNEILRESDGRFAASLVSYTRSRKIAWNLGGDGCIRFPDMRGLRSSFRA
jgi:hypothetical protein